jgi:uncharacterized protein (DUF58 family)
MRDPTDIQASDLQRFARLAAPLLQGAAARGLGPRAARNRAGPGLEFLDMRQYQPGDDVRHIDWRQTARRQQAVIRRFRDEAAADWFICTDRSASVLMDEAKWSMTIQLTAAIAYALLFAGHRVALLLFSDRIDGFQTLGRGAHQFAAVLDLMLREDNDTADTHSESTSNLGLCRAFLTQNSNAFVISDFLVPDGMRQDLRSIRASVASAHALQVLGKDELSVPASGTASLQDVESGVSRPFLMSNQVREKAQQALEAHSESLRKDCSALGVRFGSCIVGDRWENVLLEHLSTGS